MKLDANRFPSRTYNFLKINEFPMDVQIKGWANYTVNNTDSTPLLVKNIPHDAESIDTSLGKEFDILLDKDNKNSNSCGDTLVIPENFVCPDFVNIKFVNARTVVTKSDIVVHAKENSKSTVVLSFENADFREGGIVSRLRLLCESGSNLTVVLLNLAGSNCEIYSSVGALVKENASLKIIDVQLGGKILLSGSHVVLEGRKSIFEGRTCYGARDNQNADINYVVKHLGKESESRMNVTGFVKDNAKKTWRGTIDFVNGCRNAFADENEDVLLLNPEVVNKSLPVILCDEEAVEGTHGASIGRLNLDMLFYLQSRGLTKEQSENMMAKGKIYAAVNNVFGLAEMEKAESLEESVNKYIEGIFDEN